MVFADYIVSLWVFSSDIMNETKRWKIWKTEKFIYNLL